MSAYNLAGVLAHHADRFPDRPCLVWGDTTITYAELERRASRTAAGLARLSIGRGDIVALLLYNCPEFIETMFAAARRGAIVMPINWRLAGEEVAYIAGHAGAALVVSEPELAPLAEAAIRSRPGARVVGVGGVAGGWIPFEELGEGASTVPLADVAADDVHRLMYTSGTTARRRA
jgi:fatty-acyl-CoA synthase